MDSPGNTPRCLIMDPNHNRRWKGTMERNH